MNWSWVEEGLKWIGSLGVFTLGTATITGIVGYLFKTIFSHILTKQSEEYKSILNKQTESYKSELQRLNNRQQITFSKLHVDRAETIKNVYSKLVELEDSTRNLVKPLQLNGEPSKKEKVTEAYGKFNDFYSYSNVNRIYFSEEICKLIDTIKEAFKEILVSIETYAVLEDKLADDIDFRKVQRQVLLANWKRVREEIPELKILLEGEFRKLLGVIEEQQNIK